MKRNTVLASLIMTSLALSGCSSNPQAEESIDKVVQVNSDIKYFDTFNGNMDEFFKVTLDPTLQAWTDNDTTVAKATVAGKDTYRLMVKTSMTERPVVLLDEEKAKSKNCSFPTTISLSYWDVDASVLKQEFTAETPNNTFYAINKSGDKAYYFTAHEKQSGGQFVAVTLNEKKAISKVERGTFSEEVSFEQTKLPKLTVNSTVVFVGNKLTELPIKFSLSEWKSIADEIKVMKPRADESKFYGLLTSGDIVTVSFSNGNCSY